MFARLQVQGYILYDYVGNLPTTIFKSKSNPILQKSENVETDWMPYKATKIFLCAQDNFNEC
jgi:hypothetical protein